MTVIQAVYETNKSGQLVMAREADAALVARLWNGDLSALGILYDRYGSLVYGLALKGLRRVADAEDLTQEVFLCLHSVCLSAGLRRGGVS